MNMSAAANAQKKSSFMHSLLEELKASGGRSLPKPSDVITGKVLSRTRERVYVDLGGYGIGVISWDELRFLSDQGAELEPGSAINVNIVDWEDEDGFVKLSARSAGEEKRWQEISSLSSREEIIPATVLSATRGGLVVNVNGHEAFLPASQLTDEHYPRVESGRPDDIQGELSKLVGETINVKIFSWDRERGKVIVSERAVADEEIRAKIEKLEIGSIIQGKVQGIVDFGVFVGFGDGLEGLIHISELSWRLIDDPREVISVGQEVTAKIIGIEGTRVSLSLRSLEPNPWEKVGEKYAVGQRVRGTVVKLHPYGAFVRLDPDIHGLIHISEFSGSQEEMNQKLALGGEYEFEIITLEADSRRLGLKLCAS